MSKQGLKVVHQPEELRELTVWDRREDAATAEVSRSQLWQWVKHGVSTADGKRVDKAYALKLLKQCADGLASKAPKGNKFHLAAQYFAGQVTGEDYADFLTS